MRIEPDLDNWILVRGRGRGRQGVFVMLVDSTGACWSQSKPWMAQRFTTKAGAELMLDELRRRAALKKGRG